MYQLKVVGRGARNSPNSGVEEKAEKAETRVDVLKGPTTAGIATVG
jgi:hypothetical protein